MKSIHHNNYHCFPWRVIFILLFALFYILTPFDIIPDMIPVLGLGDDVAVIVWAFYAIVNKADPLL